jgi:hypothetical protein
LHLISAGRLFNQLYGLEMNKIPLFCSQLPNRPTKTKATKNCFLTTHKSLFVWQRFENEISLSAPPLLPLGSLWGAELPDHHSKIEDPQANFMAERK